MQPHVTSFHHRPTGSWTCAAVDVATDAVAGIDPVRDYDGRSGRTGTANVACLTGDPSCMPGSGTARCDSPGGGATQLHRFVQRLYQVPPATRGFAGHDCSPGGRAPRCERSITEQRAAHTHVRDGVSYLRVPPNVIGSPL